MTPSHFRKQSSWVEENMEVERLYRHISEEALRVRRNKAVRRTGIDNKLIWELPMNRWQE